MNVATMDISREEARAKLKAYRGRLHKDAEAEYAAIREAYAAVADGATVVDVDQAIRDGGFDDKMRPRLAIARADRKVVCFRWRATSHEALFTSAKDTSSWQEGAWPGLEVRVQLGRIPNLRRVTSTGQIYHDTAEGYSRVPLVPPDVRPQTGQLRDWHVLYEVDQWYDSNPLEPPRDPYLLKHLSGSLYAILAEWELTNLEIAVLRQQTP